MSTVLHISEPCHHLRDIHGQKVQDMDILPLNGAKIKSRYANREGI